MIRHTRGRMRVLAGPGTGKTATIAAAVASRIADGADPSTILVLTFARRAAVELASRIAALVEVTTIEPMVRTLHSYCYSLVRHTADVRGEPPPRMLAAGETDLVVRELLAGQLEAGASGWPAHLRPALTVPGFASELRNMMLRCAEREITPSDLAALARRHRRPEWRAVGGFMKEYREVTSLRAAVGRTGATLDQADLTVAALEQLRDPAVLAAQQRRTRRIFVDEYQDVDPAQARLIDLLAAGADELVVVGDPDQAIFAFRGAVAGAMSAIQVDETVALTRSRRLPPVLVEGSRRVAAHIPGPVTHREITSAGLEAGSLEVRVLANVSAEASFVADQLRRAHLVDGVPFSDMAVLLRAPSSSAGRVRSALTAAGVPIAGGAPLTPIADQPLVRALLTILRAGMAPASLTGEVATALLGSPVGGFDPISLRRLRRALRTACPGTGPAADLIAAMLRGDEKPPADLPGGLGTQLVRVSALVQIARTGAAEPAAEDVLWRVWSRCGLARRLAATSERGGRDGDRADLMLDGVVALFAAAADLAVRLPGAGVGGLLEMVAEQQVGTDSPVGGSSDRSRDGVAVLSAHAAKGLEWDTVVVAGVQQDDWPDLRGRADLLGLAALIDAADGIHPGRGSDSSGAPPLGGDGGFLTSQPRRGNAGPGWTARTLAEERRLFYVATTRAKRRLVVTAVEDDEHVPSRFLADLAGSGPIEQGWPRDRAGRSRRALHFPALVADLRAAVVDPTRPKPERQEAVEALRRLAAAGIRGAHPDEWQGLDAVSSDDPAVPEGQPIRLSPSQVESVLGCPLRAVLTRSGGAGAPSSPQLVGVLVHALAEGISRGVDDSTLERAVEGLLGSQEHLPAWERARTGRLIATMIAAVRSWVQTARAGRDFVGSEVPIDVALPAGDREVRIVGRADWVSRDHDGRIVVSDFKTSATGPSRAEVDAHAQLATYQVAAALGAFGASEEPGGGELVMLRSGAPKVLAQDALDSAEVGRWTDALAAAAAATIGPSLLARLGLDCDRCPVRSACPVRPEGRMVTR